MITKWLLSHRMLVRWTLFGITAILCVALFLSGAPAGGYTVALTLLCLTIVTHFVPHGDDTKHRIAVGIGLLLVFYAIIGNAIGSTREIQILYLAAFSSACLTFLWIESTR